MQPLHLCNVVKNPELQQLSSGQTRGAAAADRGQHREDKGASTVVAGLRPLRSPHSRSAQTCGLVSPQVSKASSDLMRYCGEHAKNDPLLMGIPASENPFKDKKPCTVL